MFRNKSMLSNFIKIFVLLIVIPILLINIILNKKYENVLMESYSEKVLQLMEQMSLSIDEELKTISFLASTISHDKELTALITKWSQAKDIQDKFDIASSIDSKLSSLFNYNRDVTSLIFFLKDQGFYYYNNTLNMKEEKARQMTWYKKLLENKGKVVQLRTSNQIIRSSSQKNVAVGIAPDILENTSSIEAIYLEMKTSMFNTIYSNYNTHQFGDTMIINSDRDIIVSSDKSWLSKNIYDIPYLQEKFDQQSTVLIEKVKENDAYISTYFSKKSKWMVVNIIQHNVLTQDIQDILITFIIIYVVFISLFILFTIVFFRQMIVPIKKLVFKMKSVEKGDFNDTIEVMGPKEIRDLNNSYNQMIKEIKNLIRQVDLKEKERSKEEIKALQAQINPHFIYNTVNSIRLMAMMSKAEGIKNMTDAFMKLISTTFKEENTLIPIAKELEYIENYVYIMQVRYGQNYTMAIEVDNAIKPLLTIKMILQPLVENAILHGLSEKEEGGRITVEGKLDDDTIIITVSDNGRGMTKEEIMNVMTMDKVYKRSFNQIGMMNVDRRIKLNFDERYGLTIFSEYGSYTTIQLKLPIIKEDKYRGGMTHA